MSEPGAAMKRTQTSAKAGAECSSDRRCLHLQGRARCWPISVAPSAQNHADGLNYPEKRNRYRP